MKHTKRKPPPVAWAAAMQGTRDDSAGNSATISTPQINRASTALCLAGGPLLRACAGRMAAARHRRSEQDGALMGDNYTKTPKLKRGQEWRHAAFLLLQGRTRAIASQGRAEEPRHRRDRAPDSQRDYGQAAQEVHPDLLRSGRERSTRRNRRGGVRCSIACPNCSRHATRRRSEARRFACFSWRARPRPISSSRGV